ncbi:MAG: hypothetical protein IKB04_04185 [Clostridia bacterium]|nr:hypothetical protein [Clostridia bacterium]
MDTFVEQIIVRRKTPKQTLLAILIMALTSLLITFSFIMLRAFALLLAAALGYGMWWLLSEMNIEYEYCITNGDIDIDKITARRKRERVVSVSLSKVETAGVYRPEQWQERGVDRVVMAAPSEKAEGLYCFSYRSKKRGHTLVIFQPDERVLAAFTKGLPRLLQNEINK